MCDSEPDDDGDPLAGRTIEATRPMTDDELAREGWHGRGHPPLVLELDDDTILYASRDPEGNGPGAIFQRDGDQTFYVYAGAE